MATLKKVLIGVVVFYAVMLVGCFLLVMAYAISTGLTAPDIECGPGEVEVWTGSPECVPEEEGQGADTAGRSHRGQSTQGRSHR